MTYFGFLAIFLAMPLALLGLVCVRDMRRGRRLPRSLQAWPLWVALAAHAVVAVLYTTPWDNYLVATGVWGYDPRLVAGITLGWVPLEEYIFFALQPLLAGLWLAMLARRVPDEGRPVSADPRLRRGATAVAGSVWLASLIALLSGWKPATYLALELVWALPAIIGQLAFGADVLWHWRRLIALVLVPATLFLSAADALAISQGIWAVAPEQSLNLLLGSVLPFEEFMFFLLTTTLLVFGVVLVLSQESKRRAPVPVRRGREREARDGRPADGTGGQP
jgi:lycopene cyclase domain-containing protein